MGGLVGDSPGKIGAIAGLLTRESGIPQMKRAPGAGSTRVIGSARKLSSGSAGELTENRACVHKSELSEPCAEFICREYFLRSSGDSLYLSKVWV